MPLPTATTFLRPEKDKKYGNGNAVPRNKNKEIMSCYF